MKNLNTWQNAVFRLGAILMLAGAAAFMFQHVLAFWLYVIGCLGFCCMQALAGYEGRDLAVKRLRRQQLMGCVFFFLAAVCMSMQVFHWGRYMRNEWVVMLTIGCVLELYTSWRLPSVLSHSGKKGVTVLFLAAVLGTSCSDRYMVSGTSSVQGLEGKMLYLKAFCDTNLQVIDSSRVVHGQFNFNGIMDSVVLASLFFEDTSIMPVVLETGQVSVNIEESKQSATGTPLNDTLNAFVSKKTQLEAQMAELPHAEAQMIMDGMEHDDIIRELSDRARALEVENDMLVTGFIRSNYNNVLGPGVFMILTSSLRYPILNPQIEDIISQAPPYFLSHPYVREYIKVAEENMKKLREE